MGTSIEKFYKLKAFYPEIMSIRNFSLEKFKTIYDKVKDIESDNSLCVKYENNNELKYVALSLILRLKKFKSVKFLNAYELIDIYLGNVEEYKTIFDLKQDIILVYFTGTEFENRRQDDIVIQLGENLLTNNRHLWILTTVNIQQKYPALHEWLKQNEIETITLGQKRMEIEEI